MHQFVVYVILKQAFTFYRLFVCNVTDIYLYSMEMDVNDTRFIVTLPSNICEYVNIRRFCVCDYRTI